MKYCRFDKNNPKYGIIENNKVKVISGDIYSDYVVEDEEYSLDEIDFLPPSEPSKVVCVGKNYFDHIKEFGGPMPKNPILFIKGSNALNCHNGDIVYPPHVKQLDFEGELCFIIKKTAKKVKRENALDYIMGFSILNDVTARDIQRLDEQWTRAKSMDGFCPIGPIVTDEVDPNNLNICTRLNGKIKQSANTSLFMYDVSFMLEFITESMTLYKGDVVSTGTPCGVGPMQVGDVVEIEIENIGILKNKIIKE